MSVQRNAQGECLRCGFTEDGNPDVCSFCGTAPAHPDARPIEARIAELRKVEYPTMAQMAELDRLRNTAAKLNESEDA